ncbi:TPA: hypothetical protein N0F65_005586 [Lagenidium giganteum]|uniref:EF-hand domain-containing protein n=1 Tax=Lagenidium giganteum TaxID=4803 RepID=A0AAV2Z7Q3_9STRA|nr:TPA: hypothetical protein N0F65_005586 [Lagenidium giganteum]
MGADAFFTHGHPPASEEEEEQQVVSQVYGGIDDSSATNGHPREPVTNAEQSNADAAEKGPKDHVLPPEIKDLSAVRTTQVTGAMLATIASSGSRNSVRRDSSSKLTQPIMRLDTQRRSAASSVRRRLSSVLKLAGLDFLEDTEADRAHGLWDVFDVDGDGIVDYDEFCQYSCDLIHANNTKGMQQTLTDLEVKLVQILQDHLEHTKSLDVAIRRVFEKLDQNRSGRISQMEFQEGIRALGIIEYNFEVHGQKRRFVNNSLFFLNTTNPFRLKLVWLVEWKWFDRFILLCIVANSIALGLRDYQDPALSSHSSANPNTTNTIVDKTELLFTIVFAVECVLKIIAMGFLFGKGAYLRNYWNLLDFFVVVVGLIGDLPGVPKVSSLRTARVLRPLRTLSNLRGMRTLVYSLLSAIPALFNVLVILSFVFTVFGILGVLFWNGALTYRCRTTPGPIDGVWQLAPGGRACGGSYNCAANEFCRSVYDNNSLSATNLTDAEGSKYAYTNFDSIGMAVFTLFQCITLEGWTVVMYNYQDAYGWTFSTIYFVVFTIIGAFFLVHFVFAVIWERFNAANDGTAGEWNTILQELGEEITPDPNTRTTVEAKIEGFRKRPSISQHMKESFRKSVVVARKNNPLRRLRALCRDIVSVSYFSHFIVLCILLNTICLALDEYPANATRDNVTEKLNLILTFVFSLEMALKLMGLGLKNYCKDKYNIFDGLVVIISLIELVLNFVNPDSKSNSGLSALRSFRLFRIMKLARSWKSLRELVETMANSVVDVANFGLLLLLLMYVFALIGTQFFANRFRFNDDGDFVEWRPDLYEPNSSHPHPPWSPEMPYTISRSNFDDTLAAFTTVFQCLTEESWNFVMYDGIRSSGWSAAAYFISVMVIGNIIVLNLFLAILLGNFTTVDQTLDTSTSVIRGQLQVDKALSSTLRDLKVNAVVPAPESNGVHPSDKPTHKPRKHKRRRSHASHASQHDGRRSTHESEHEEHRTTALDHHVSHATVDGTNTPEHSTSEVEEVTPRQARIVRLQTLSTSRRSQTKRDPEMVQVVAVTKPNRSLFLFQSNNPFRHLCRKMISHPVFENLILAIIFLSSIQLAIDNPLNDPDSTLSVVLATMDNIFNGVFMIEMMLKVVDFGFIVNGPKSYLRDPWNVLDFGILLSSLATMIWTSNALRSIRSLRTLRALRPLRVISRVPGMKRVVNALLASIPCILNVFLVCGLIFLIFGIVGTNLFKGRMYYCDMSSFNDTQMARLEDTYGFSMLRFKQLFSQQNCTDEGGTWVLNHRNYDNVLKSSMTLFEISTTEGWVDIMHAGVDATEIGYHPVVEYNRSVSIFFIVFIIIGSFFTLNLFVGAVIDNFNRLRDSMQSEEAESETQHEWLQIQDMIRAYVALQVVTPFRADVYATKLSRHLDEPKNVLRKACFYLQQHAHFEALIATCVLLNTIMLAITHFRQDRILDIVLDNGNILFWLIFAVEAIVKLMAMGRHYFMDNWNRFDFLVVCGSTVSMAMQFYSHGHISPVANTLRAFRMGLALRLMKRAMSMQTIVQTILDNMPALVNVSTLMFLIMFVYAIIGVQLYAPLMLGDALNEHANFKDVFTALLTLFRFTTGEAWNDVMYDMMVEPIEGEAPYPYGTSCVDDLNYTDLAAIRKNVSDPLLTNGCTPGVPVTYMYFISYMLITSYVMVNLFVAVILEGFEETTEKNASYITREDLDHVCMIWEKYDPRATGFASDHAFLKFLRDVPPPLGLPPNSRRRDVERWASSLNLFLTNDRISFNAFLIAAAQHVMFLLGAERGDVVHAARAADSFFIRSTKAVRSRVAKPRVSVTTTASLVVIMSVKRIQAVVRTKMARKRVQQLQAQRLAMLLEAATEDDNSKRENDDEFEQSAPDGRNGLMQDEQTGAAIHGRPRNDSVPRPTRVESQSALSILVSNARRHSENK